MNRKRHQSLQCSSAERSFHFYSTYFHSIYLLKLLFFLKETGMSIYCPKCGSHHVIQRNMGRKVGGSAGMIAGSASGAVGALGGAKTGATLGIIGGPPGIALGSLVGAMMGALIGAGTGGLAGAKIGEQLDHRVFDNHQCQVCGHAFSVRQQGELL